MRDAGDVDEGLLSDVAGDEGIAVNVGVDGDPLRLMRGEGGGEGGDRTGEHQQGGQDRGGALLASG